MSQTESYDLNSEKAVLGAMILNNHCIEEVIDFLKPEHFFDRENANIYEAIHRLHYDTRMHIDGASIREELEVMGEGWDPGVRIAHLQDIIENAPHGESPLGFACNIVEIWLKRQLESFGHYQTNIQMGAAL
ncbi:DnaB-like helicase N-terminal domain-containing protein [Gimesia chilikensis]|uniref:DnaB-like helicase N-terminal domain-containing protein n=1 Tax=Gimesia chilikensis TaxID=2605989 RepID=UPI003A9006A8